MKTYEFSVILAAADVTDAECDVLYEAGCDDGSIITRNMVTHIAFSRKAVSLEEAIRSAIADVQKAGFRVAKVELEPASLIKA